MRVQTIQREVFTFDELSDDAKQKVCSREGEHFETWFIYDDIVRMAEILGIEIDTHPVKLYGGGTSSNPCIYWSGFWSQGDGACFTGTYQYAKGSTRTIRAESNDGDLHQIADDLRAVQRKNFYRLEAKITHRDRYYHAHSMDIDVVDREDQYRDLGDAEDAIKEALRDFANWMYKRIEEEYEYQTSEEAVRETANANDWEFYENGDMA